jgi:hypothetical protein
MLTATEAGQMGDYWSARDGAGVPGQPQWTLQELRHHWGGGVRHHAVADVLEGDQARRCTGQSISDYPLQAACTCGQRAICPDWRSPWRHRLPGEEIDQPAEAEF